MRKNGLVTTAVVISVISGASVAPVLAGTTPLTTVRVASSSDGIFRPVYVTAPSGDYDRIFILEQSGRIKILTGGAVLPTPYLNIDSRVGGGTSGGDERGLLGLAFHPDYFNNGYFFVDYTNNSGNTVIARYQVSGDPLTSDVADVGSETILMTISQPFGNHNGGWIDFGPNDGYLYISLGDGGSGGDPGDRAQDITNQKLGKMLRIDVDSGTPYGIPPDNPFVGITGDDEIWAYGLRNAWRNSFDPETGDLYMADVGQNAWEEIDFQRGESSGGENYGWRCMEGNHCYTSSSGCTCNSGAVVDPIYEYNHSLGFSLTGGEIYRGCMIPDLTGTYFYADYVTHKIWSFRYNGISVVDFADRTSELAPGGGLAISNISSFGRDGLGEMYICDLFGGEVFQIVADVPPFGFADCDGNTIPDACDVATCDGSPECADCNGNQVPDPCDLTGGTALDCDANAIPDSCDIAGCDGSPDCADCNANLVPDGCDITAGTAFDCNANAIPDSCDITGCDGSPACADCNLNLVPDGCDIAGGGSTDSDGNGVPDECIRRPMAEDRFHIDGTVVPCSSDADCLVGINAASQTYCVLPPSGEAGSGVCYVQKSKYVSIDPNPANDGALIALRVSLDLGAGQTAVLGWVGAPAEVAVIGSGPSPQLEARVVDEASRHYRDWSVDDLSQPWVDATVHLGDCEISPAHTYLIQAILSGADVNNEVNYTEALALSTVALWADVVGADLGTPPDSERNFRDISALVRGFQNIQTEPRPWHELQGSVATPDIPEMDGISFTDINRAVAGFQGASYPWDAPCDCPGQACP